MFYVFRIFVFSLVCFVTSSHKCKQIEDEKVTGITEEFVQKFAEDVNNVTKHIDVYLAKLRETLKNGELPADSVKYYFFTSKNPSEPYNLTISNDTFKNIPYNKKKPLLFGIHGYSAQIDFQKGLTAELVQALVKLNKYNVIFIDYSKLCDVLLSAAVPRAYLAAKDIVRFLQLLMSETGTKREQIHVIGVSLGGQMAGIVGNNLPGLGRITGLDPGGVFFVDFPKDLRLDRSDANFVDVIRTADAYPFPKGLGFYPPCGHLDFYPNGGKFQPGCNSTIPIDQFPTTEAENVARICMHNRVIVYYFESIICSQHCQFVATMCDSYEKYEKGLCTKFNSRTAIMGEFAKKPWGTLPENARFFLDTNDHYPFCKRKQPGCW